MIGITAVVVVVGVPIVMGYYHNAQNTAGAQHIRTLLNQARQLAIEEKDFVGFTVSASANPVFDYLGRALPAATFTVTNTVTGSTLTVSVAPPAGSRFPSRARLRSSEARRSYRRATSRRKAAPYSKP